MVLMKHMMYLRYQDETPMTDNVNAFQSFVNQLSSMNVKFDDEVLGIMASWYIAGFTVRGLSHRK